MVGLAGSIDYEEFLAATVNLNHLEKEDTMYNAFRHFDADNSGYISQAELEDALMVTLIRYCVFSTNVVAVACWQAVLNLQMPSEHGAHESA